MMRKEGGGGAARIEKWQLHHQSAEKELWRRLPHCQAFFISEVVNKEPVVQKTDILTTVLSTWQAKDATSRIDHFFAFYPCYHFHGFFPF